MALALVSKGYQRMTLQDIGAPSQGGASQLSLKRRGLRLAILTAALLLGALLALASIVGHALTLWTMALAAGVDLLSHVFTLWLVSVSARPADHKHNYGYGKFENLCALAVALLIAGMAVFGGYEAAHKLFHPPEDTMEFALVAVAAAVSSLKDTFVTRRLRRIVQQAPSPSVSYTADHLRIKAITDGTVAVAMLVSAVAKVIWPEQRLAHFVLARVDPFVAIILQILVVRHAIHVIHDGLQALLDRTLPEDMQVVILRALSKYDDLYCNFGQIRSRRAGPQVLVDIEIVYPADWTLARAAEAARSFEGLLGKEIASDAITVFPVPCKLDCLCRSRGLPCPYSTSGPAVE